MIIFSLYRRIKDLTAILEKSEEPDELQYYWIEWYNKAGTTVRSKFDEYVALNKEAAILNSKVSPVPYLGCFFEDTVISHFKKLQILRMVLKLGSTNTKIHRLNNNWKTFSIKCVHCTSICTLMFDINCD